MLCFIYIYILFAIWWLKWIGFVFVSPIECQVINHRPICSCASGYTGDPFTRCYEPIQIPKQPENPCIPTPCGPHSECKVINESPACSCLPTFLGSAPHCRPECSINSECPAHLACMNQKCVDPCPGSCGINTQCAVINHTPSCTCDAQYTGDPFQGCVPIQVQGKYPFFFHSFTCVTSLKCLLLKQRKHFSRGKFQPQVIIHICKF